MMMILSRSRPAPGKSGSDYYSIVFVYKKQFSAFEFLACGSHSGVAKGNNFLFIKEKNKFLETSDFPFQTVPSSWNF